jgi:hypothetical protein
MDSGPLKTYLLVAKLQNQIRRLGKWRKEQSVSRFLEEAEELGVDIIHGRKPYRSGEVVGSLASKMGYLRYSQCKEVEYGLRQDRLAELNRVADALREHRQRTEQGE